MFFIEEIIPDLIYLEPLQYFCELFDDFYHGNFWENEIDNKWIGINDDGMSIFY